MLSLAPRSRKAATLAAAVLIAVCASSSRVAAMSVQISFIVDHYKRSDDAICDAGLDRPKKITLEVYYRTAANATALPGVCTADDWKHLETVSSSAVSRVHTNVSLPVGVLTPFQLRMLQLDHAGGDCSNWELLDINVWIQDTPIPINCTSCFICAASDESSINGSTATFYNESASMPRGLLTHWLDLAAGLSSGNAEGLIRKNENCSGPECLLPWDTEQDKICSNDIQEAHIDLSFLLHWSYDYPYTNSCNPMNSDREGIELSIRQNREPIWRPLAYFVKINLPRGPKYINLGYHEGNNLYIRGYLVRRVVHDNMDVQHNISIQVCDPRYLEAESVQFRWLQTSRVNAERKDMWSLDDVKVDVVRESRKMLFWEDFENYTANETLPSPPWSEARRAYVLEDSLVCNHGRNGKALSFFNGNRAPSRRNYTQSRSFTTTDIDVPAGPDQIIFRSAELRTIYSEIQIDAAGGLCSLLSYLDGRQEVNETEVVALLLTILDNIGNTTVSNQFSQNFFNVSSLLMAIVSSRNTTENPSSLAGSTLLSLNDDFALINHNTTVDSVSTINLGFIVTEEEKEVEEAEVTFDSGGFSITLPEELYSQEQTNMEEAQSSSFLYSDMSGFLDNTLPKSFSSGSQLAGPVLSSFLHCPNRVCDTSGKLKNNKTVRLVFPNVIGSDDTLPACVFWEFGKRRNNSFIPGEWSTKDCVTLATGPNITCECTHLTHFAILLSPGIETSDEVSLSLKIIGIVGVSISLVALAATVFTFIFFRSLWSMRNYIHVQLCVSLALAQLVFVAAVEPSGNEDVCSAMAVLLHYLFLVSFMWMLMEGVVLYVALVRVFVENHIRYSIAFTIASYGLPLLYMAVCVPLGFVLHGSDGRRHYGNDKACWLRYDTHFVWAFISPVILIVMINIGFFIMAIAIMCRHQQRQDHQSNSEKVRHWLKASISLTVVMGITWVMGVLVFTEALLFVAYIFTIFVAFQGLIIFILLVVLSQQVRETYSKWWKVKVANSEFLSKHLSEDGIGITFLTRLKNSKSGTTSPIMDKNGGVESTNSNIYVSTKSTHSQEDTIL